MAPPHYSNNRGSGGAPHHQLRRGGGYSYDQGTDPRSDRRTGPGGHEEGRGYHKSRDMYQQQQGGRGYAPPPPQQQQQQHYPPQQQHHHHQGGRGGGGPGYAPAHHHHHHHHRGGGGYHRGAGVGGSARPFSYGHSGGVERYADGRRKVANYDFEESILKKIGSCNMPVYFSYEPLTAAQLKDPSLFRTALPPGAWMTPELPIRVTKLTCTIKELLRFIGTYLLASDNGQNPDRAQVQQQVAQKIPEGSPISVFLYKQLADEKDVMRPIEGVVVDALVEGQPLSMMTVQTLEEARKEMTSDPEQPNDPFHRPVFDSRSSRESIYNGNGIFVVCPTAPTSSRLD